MERETGEELYQLIFIFKIAVTFLQATYMRKSTVLSLPPVSKSKNKAFLYL